MRRILVWIAVTVIVVAAILVGGRKTVNATTFQVAGQLVDRANTEERVVALTFDDGPTVGDADAILDVLADKSVPATFYLTGQQSAEYPEVVTRIAQAGHELGNHTWSHRRMVFLTPAEAAQEIESTDDALRSTGYDGPLTYRPPYGKKLVVAPLYLAQHGRITVTWDVSVETWDGSAQSAEEIVELSAQATRPGSIILLHPWHGRTQVQAAISPLIDRLQAEGYRFVTVSQLLSLGVE